MSKHTIAVIIPAYNAEPWIRDCLDSVIGQTIPFDEVIIVNDGSTDNTLTICEQYAKENPYIRIADQANKGPGAARNTGMELVSSDYFVFVDSDDYLVPAAVSVLSGYISSQSIDAVYFDRENIGIPSYLTNNDLYHRDYSAIKENTIYKGADFFSLAYPRGFSSQVWLTLYRTELIRESGIRFEEGVVYEDNLFSYQYLMESSRVICIPDRLYTRRFRSDSIMTSPYSAGKLNDHISVTCSAIDHMISKGHSRADKHLLYAGNLSKLCVIGYLKCMDMELMIGRNIFEKLKGLLLRYLSLFDSDTCPDRLLSMDNMISYIQIWYFCRYMKFIDADHMNDIKKVISGQVKQFFDDLYGKTLLGRETARVGIYCVGKNTINMEELFGRLYGSPKAEVIYIDTAKAGNEYKGQRIFSYDEVRGTMDSVVVSRVWPVPDLVGMIKQDSPEIAVCDIGSQADTSLFSLGRFMFIDYE